MEAIFSILLLVAIGALIIGGLMLLRKARRKTGLITVGVAFVALAVSVGQVNSITEQETLAKDQEAHALGFLDHDDQVLASTFGYASSSAEQWVEVREEKIQERADEHDRHDDDDRRVDDFLGRRPGHLAEVGPRLLEEFHKALHR